MPHESFLCFSPSGPQAFAGFYGTIQRGSATELYVFGSNFGAVEKDGLSFPRAGISWGNRVVSGQDRYWDSRAGEPQGRALVR